MDILCVETRVPIINSAFFFFLQSKYYYKTKVVISS
jgi:hypothetical protein